VATPPKPPDCHSALKPYLSPCFPAAHVPRGPGLAPNGFPSYNDLSPETPGLLPRYWDPNHSLPEPNGLGRLCILFAPCNIPFRRRPDAQYTALRGGFQVNAEPAQTVYEFSATLLNGPTLSLEEFRGRVLLIVNTASQCGFTPQYAGLEDLYRAYRDRGFEVLGFPCNQFGAQEPGSAEEIGAFCLKNFGVSFPLFAKIDVNGPLAHPLYGFLKQKKPGILGIFGARGIKWNFTKFLVDRKGNVVGRYGPSTRPQALAAAIEGLLGSA
jgi:glutathione peroxidase